MGKPAPWSPTQTERDRAMLDLQLRWGARGKTDAVIASLSASVDALLQEAYEQGKFDASETLRGGTAPFYDFSPCQHPARLDQVDMFRRGDGMSVRRHVCTGCGRVLSEPVDMDSPTARMTP